ncbi:cytochrome c-type biogenesis protein [Alkalibacterium putridalgicola]|uniref:Cytochrome C biogenesis protein CcdA n=1 Tax=Alkalibacterium putridalgicola TaxID=426703 RepID=A0A1H7XME8_9LACT|nr:cytochrome c biogenesis protein CcdA [Alkalibacterium putridalgicola]GEK90316.1 cytochrome C biogenesis protein CcdA [Alkalibacterium putridalgicola]SEM34398.1 cytochrome c-type biogenesis protein [Alkalibacterium putridalgicola]
MAFGAGALSFFSPCTLPLLPLYLSYITGKSVKEVKENQSAAFKRTVMLHSILFLIGVSVVYVSLGLSISYLGGFFSQLLTGSTSLLLQRIAGLLIIVMGLVTAEWLQIPALLKDTRRMAGNRTTSYFSSFFIGLGFAAGWTPCIGPIFSSILLIGVSTGSPPALYLTLYILGFALPFLLVSFFLGKMDNIMKHSQKWMKVGGILMIVMGLLLFTGTLEIISEWIAQWLEGTPFELLG